MAPILSSCSPEICFFLPPWACQVCPAPRSCLAISHHKCSHSSWIASGHVLMSPCDLVHIPVCRASQFPFSLCAQVSYLETQNSVATVFPNCSCRRTQDAMRQPPFLQGMWTCHPISSVDVPSSSFLGLYTSSFLSMTVQTLPAFTCISFCLLAQLLLALIR